MYKSTDVSLLSFFAGKIPKTEDDQIFLKYCSDLYTLKKPEKITPRTIQFNTPKRDDFSKFREIIVKHYGEEKFDHKGKNGKNGYQCKSENEDVTITLYLGTLKLFIQGRGCEQWIIGTFNHLVKQLYNEVNNTFQIIVILNDSLCLLVP